MVEGGESVGGGLSLDFPVLGKIGPKGSGGDGGGRAVLDSFFEALGPSPKREDPAIAAMRADAGEPWSPPYERDQAIEDLPKILGKSEVDQLRNERDILLVVNHALESVGVKTMAEFAAWISKQLWNAERSGFVPKPHPMVPQEPQITHLARYIEWVRDAVKQDASRRA